MYLMLVILLYETDVHLFTNIYLLKQDRRTSVLFFYYVTRVTETMAVLMNPMNWRPRSVTYNIKH